MNPEQEKSDKLAILQHSLGLDKYGEGRPYRNHYVTGEGSRDFRLCQELANQGLMIRHPPSPLSGGQPIFAVTPEGRRFIQDNSPIPPKLTRNQKTYQEYLKTDGIFDSFGDFLRQKQFDKKSSRW